MTWSRGPEYLRKTVELKVDGPTELAVELERWIDPAKHGWYSGDHHIHAAGCSHYDNPTQGVSPLDMWRQVEGEALNVGSVLTWGPCYYHQKRHFSGQDHPVSKPGHLVHYDLEVSGFPSSHAGHLVLLGLRDQDYPGTTRIEHWPSWDLPILQWAKGQGAVTGFAHSGFGLAVAGTDLPSYEMPAFDGIGANEYVVDVTHDAVDFISAGDTQHLAELNIWYHTLNVGFRTRISGETDFPCLTDDRVGEGRTYAKLDGPLTYRGFIEAIRAGRSYVSDGRSHLMDFRVNGTEVGTAGSEVRLDREGPVRVALKVSARLPETPDEELRSSVPGDFLVQFLGPFEKPYWDLRRARIGRSREVPVEIVVNGRAVARRTVVADGTRAGRRARGPGRPQQLDRRADPALLPHEPHLRHRRRQAGARFGEKRAVVPRRRRPVLEPEEGADDRGRAGGGASRVRARAAGLPAPSRGIPDGIDLKPLTRPRRYPDRDSASSSSSLQKRIPQPQLIPPGARAGRRLETPDLGVARDGLAGLGQGAHVAEGDRLEGQVAQGRGLHGAGLHGKAGGVGRGLVRAGRCGTPPPTTWTPATRSPVRAWSRCRTDA